MVFSVAMRLSGLMNHAGKGIFTRVVSRFLYIVVAGRRRVALRNIERAFGNRYSPSERARLVKESYSAGVRTVVEGFASLSPGGPEHLVGGVRVEGLDRVKKALGGGKGAICISSHYGPFPFIGAVFPALGLKPFYFLYRRPKNVIVAERFDWWLNRVGCGVIEDNPKSEAVKRVLRALGGGSCVCILVDQHFPAGVEIPFFGHSAKTGVGAAVLSARSGAPLIPLRIRADRSGKFRYLLEVDEPVPPPVDTSETELKSCMSAITARVEAWIREDPSQWFWVHRRWKDLDRAEDSARRSGS